ncbi:MAG: transposase [Chloroflexi bacterium]|nr:transposase [Chloroflexota bacterium]
MSNLDYRLFYHRHLPHIQPKGATIFVTFRLADSIPAVVLRQLVEESKRIESLVGKIPDLGERYDLADKERRKLFGKWDEALDKSKGRCWLRDPLIAKMVVESWRHFDGKRYTLDALCVMHNHVHVVFEPLAKPDGSYHSMSAIMHSLKRHTARQANKTLKREGDFWQHESYDHVVRGEAEWRRIVNYVLNNPVKAGFAKRAEDWQWSYCKFW